MRSAFRLVAVVLVVVGLCRGQAPTPSYVSATLAVGGSEKIFSSGLYDSGAITVSFNGFVESVAYSQFSTPASVAADLAAKFSADYHFYGLYVQAGIFSPNKVALNRVLTQTNLITFQLTGGQTFGQITDTLPSDSFTLTPGGFSASSPATLDSGTVTITVQPASGPVQTVATARYNGASKAETVAQGLAASASSSLATLQSDGNQLYLNATVPGSAGALAYTVTIASDEPSLFPSPSFLATPSSGTLAASSSGPETPKTIYNYGVTYDAVSNVKTLSDSVMGNWTYGYDSLNRLTTGQGSSEPYAAYPNICWSYDLYGNRLEQTGASQPFAAGSGSCSSRTSGTLLASSVITPDLSNRVSSVKQLTSGSMVTQTAINCPTGSTTTTSTGNCYDAAGNVLADAVNQYLYDAEGMLCAVHGPSGITVYQYDADGKRVGKGTSSATTSNWTCNTASTTYVPTTDYVLDIGGDQMTEVAVSGWSAGSGTPTATYTWSHTNVWADGALIATYDTTGSGLHFYLDDPLGTRRAQTNALGQFEQSCQSLPFGDQLNCPLSNTSPTEQHFTGKERDIESGLDYFGARYYASSMGRWMSPDWSAKEEPVPYARLDNPQTLNLYGYMLSNPLGGVDADGHVAAGICGKGGQACKKGDTSKVLKYALVGAAVPVAAVAAVVALPEEAVAAAGAAVFNGARALSTAAVGFCLFHCQTIAAHLAEAGAPPGPSPWSLGWGARGLAIEKQLGGNLPEGFKTIDRFIQGEATSIKSLDLNASSYQTGGKLLSVIEGYIDKLAAFNGDARGGVEINAAQILGRELQLAVPSAGTAVQQGALSSASAYAQKQGVKLTITQVK